ncbi:hypothetical protein LX70_02650 [Defluviimonas denitrificans]|jgi:hypothetical protein|uniref:Uncharacterized protein n=1 Tax=Albidovulum denitrificans TaxID=404881 RepID=A0A2S8S6I0_9RHOB|nr:hypothetical protein [Defluviimonas denitrificans]PQV56384.1 hypothetical protein LX70_02650 [Defluviimonas denitrificans]
MNPVVTISVPVYLSRPNPVDQRLGEAEATVGGAEAQVVLTTRGLYLTVQNGPSWGIDLNALTRAMADAVAPPKEVRHG